MTKEIYDLLVIGAGPAGGSAAATAAERGARVALVERDQLGGTCLNYGCDPTKTLLHTAHLLYQARRAGRYGLRIPSAEADWPAVMAHVKRTIDKMRGGSDEQARANLARKGIDVLKGEARFVGPHEVAVDGRRLQAEQIIIAAGSQAIVPEIEGLHDTGFITNKEAVALPRLPRRLAVVGGGPIGIEFAQMFHRFGVEVIVLEREAGLLLKDDRELTGMLCKLLAGEGMRLETEVDLRCVQKDRAGKRLTIRCGKRANEEVQVDEILVAIGYRPALNSLDLGAAGVETTDKGITVDATLRTNVPHIWSAGDASSRYQFTHVATEQGHLAARNAFAAEPQPFDERAIPWVTYTDPELAHVGKTEEQLREEGIAYRLGCKPLDEVERARLLGREDGLIKLLVGEDGTILGGHILAASAGELLAPVVLAMRAGLKAQALVDTILPYPTMAEGVRWAAQGVV